MTFTDPDDGKSLAVLKPIQTIQTIDDTKCSLLNFLNSGSHLVIDCSHVIEADLTLIQLLVAARRSADKRRVTMRLDHISTPVAEIVQKSGIIGNCTTDDGFWDGATP